MVAAHSHQLGIVYLVTLLTQVALTNCVQHLPTTNTMATIQNPEEWSYGMLPAPASAHGTTVVTVIVGRGDQAQPFTIHKNLLSRASSYFCSALKSNFREGCKETLELEEDCPMIFEVLYRWLYSGYIFEANNYTQGRIPDDVLWLRVYKFADMRLLDELQGEAYTALKQTFHSEERQAPSLEFVAELFNSEMLHLQQYIVGHTAYLISRKMCLDWEKWEAAMSHVQSYGFAVGVQMLKINCAPDRFKGHPAKDKEYDQHKPRTETRSADESAGK